MRTLVHPLPVLIAVTALSIAAAGCGSDDGDGAISGSAGDAGAEREGPAVAAVGDEAITRRELDRRVDGLERQHASGGPTLDTPQFAKCMAEVKKLPLREGARMPSDATLRRQCRRNYRRLERQALEQLITMRWVEAEARDRGVRVTAEQVRRSIERDAKRSYPNAEDPYGEMLRTANSGGKSERDVIFELRAFQLQSRVMQKMKDELPEPTDREIARYYRRHKGEFEEIQPGRAIPLGFVEDRIRRLIVQEREQRLLQSFQRRITRKFRPETTCGRRLVVEQCAERAKVQDSSPL